MPSPLLSPSRPLSPRLGLAWKAADQPASRSAVAPPPCDTINTRLSSLALSFYHSLYLTLYFSLSLLLYLYLAPAASISFLSRFVRPRRTAERLRSQQQQQPAAASNRRQKRARLAVRFEAVFLLLCWLPLTPLLSPPLSLAHSVTLFLSILRSLSLSLSPRRSPLLSLPRPATLRCPPISPRRMFLPACAGIVLQDSSVSVPPPLLLRRHGRRISPARDLLSCGFLLPRRRPRRLTCLPVCLPT